MLTVERSQVLTELKSVPMFRRMSPEALEHLAEIAQVRVVPKGEVVMRQGEPGSEMCVLLHGALRVSAVSEGHDLVLSVAGPGEVLGEMALLDGHPRSATVSALDKCQVLSIDRDTFLGLLREQPDIAISLLVCMTQRVRLTTEHATDIAFLDIYQRLLRQLRRLAEENGRPLDDGAVEITHPVTTEMLAKMVAARTDAIDRLVASLESEGVLRRSDDDHFVIADLERLSAHATPLMY